MKGQHLTIEWRGAEGSLERFATLVEEIVRLQGEVMVVPNQITAHVTQQTTTTMPIIIAGGGAEAQSGSNLAQPSGNVTGLAGLGPELAPTRLELLTHAVPGLTRVAVLRGLAGQRLQLQAMEGGARALGVQLQLLEARDPPTIDEALAAASREGASALMVFGDGGTYLPHRAHLAELAVTHRLPSIFVERAFVRDSAILWRLQNRLAPP